MIYKNLYFILGHKVIRVQLCLGILCTLVVTMVLRNYNSALSAITGVGLVVLPTIAYALVAFTRGLVSYPEVALGRHQKAMVLRFVVNFILFTLVLLVYRQCNFVVLFITYLVTLSGYWFSLIKH